MATTDYLEKLVESAKDMMDNAGLAALWKKLHLAARGHAGGKGKARAIEAAKDEELLAAHKACHEGLIIFKKDAEGNFAAVPTDAEKHADIHAEMRKRGLIVLDADPVEKASANRVRQAVEMALREKHGQNEYPWVADLEDMPEAGSFVYQLGDKCYRAKYQIVGDTCTILEEEEVQQSWVPVAKVYSSIDDLPEGAKDLPKHAKEIMLAAFNAAFEEYDEDEERAWATAWAAVKTKYRKQGEKWVSKSEHTILKADEEGKIYGLAAIADDEAIAKWAEAGGNKDDAPDVVDTQGEWMSEATLTEMAEGYLAKCTGPGKGLKVKKNEAGELVFLVGTEEEIAKAVEGIVGIQHSETLADARLLQSGVIYKGTRWPTPDSDPLEVACAWAYAVQTDNPDIRKAVKDGSITGFSIGGRGERVE